MDEVDDILQHYGKLGMRWGVRTAVAVRTRPGQPQPVMIGERPGKKLVTAGGRGHPASEEAKVAAGLGQKVKKSGVQSLSNKELKELNERLNLEQNYSKLATTQNKATMGKGKKMALSLLSTTTGIGKTQLTKAANDEAAKRVAKILARGASTP